MKKALPQSLTISVTNMGKITALRKKTQTGLLELAPVASDWASHDISRVFYHVSDDKIHG